MERIPSVEPERAGLNRRGFLATGAVAAIGGALLPAREALALEIGEGAAPAIEKVFPLTGAEGDSLILVGEGFAPEPENNWIVLGNGSARVEVVHASRTHLVGVIGPVVAPGEGAVHVFTGAPARPVETVVERHGLRSVAIHRRLSRVRSVAPGAGPFRLLRRSPFTAGEERSPTLEIELDAGPARTYCGARLDLGPREGKRHSVEVEVATGSAGPEEFARHLADHLRGAPAGAPVSARARGTRLLLIGAGPLESPGAADWVRVDLRTTAVSRRGSWFSSWSGRLG